jgi:hypothetical protein
MKAGTSIHDMFGDFLLALPILCLDWTISEPLAKDIKALGLSNK